MNQSQTIFQQEELSLKLLNTILQLKNKILVKLCIGLGKETELMNQNLNIAEQMVNFKNLDLFVMYQ